MKVSYADSMPLFFDRAVLKFQVHDTLLLHVSVSAPDKADRFLYLDAPYVLHPCVKHHKHDIVRS